MKRFALPLALVALLVIPAAAISSQPLFFTVVNCCGNGTNVGYNMGGGPIINIADGDQQPQVADMQRPWIMYLTLTRGWQRYQLSPGCTVAFMIAPDGNVVAVPY